MWQAQKNLRKGRSEKRVEMCVKADTAENRVAPLRFLFILGGVLLYRIKEELPVN